MLDEQNFFFELSKLYNEVENKNELTNKTLNYYFKELRSLFYNFVYFFLKDQTQFFPTNFSRINFIIHNYQISDDIKKNLIYLHATFNKKMQPSKEKIILVVKLLYDTFTYFFKDTEGINLNLNISTISLPPEAIEPSWKGEKNGQYSFLKVIVNSIDKENNKIYCFIDTNEIEINCSEYWSEIPKIVSKGTFLNCLNLQQISENKFQTTSESLIIIEPDYLYDITDISQCFSQKGSNAYLYFVNKFLPKQTSYYVFLGNLINQIFDNLLTEANITFEDAFNKSISKKILAYLVLKSKDQSFEKNILNDVREHFQTLLKVIEFLKKYPFQIEPTFFSAEFGLIGRIDLLLENNDVENWKTILELKSGNHPRNNIVIKLEDKTKFQVSMWPSHYAQIVGYNLLLSSAIKNRIGSSLILYSKSKEKPLRDAGTTLYMEREFVKTRNWVYLLEMLLSKGKFSLFETVEKQLKNKFNNTKYVNYFELLNSAEPILNSLIKEYIKFLTNENIITKIGDNITTIKASQSSLWNVPLEEKCDLETCLTDLVLNKAKSDFIKGYVFFEREKTEFNFCSLRKGDPVVIYHPNMIQNEFSFQLFKGVIKQIEPEFLIVSLRNKFSNWNKFSEQFGWILEQDITDSNSRYLFHSLFNLLLSSKEKINYLLGKKEPERKLKIKHQITLDSYSKIIQDAIEYYPYYLIIGPPGTGKTKLVLKQLLIYYLINTKFNILVCTYTNRAIDEIVEILQKEQLSHLFIRIGTKESSEYTDNLLPYLSEELSPSNLERKIFESRAYLGTAYSFLTNIEIFELKKFDVAIVDEASQLLFPHLAGILSQVDKFILIGDEKQLPSVVLQDDTKSKTRDKNLIEIGFENLAMSYFEFLIKVNRKKGINDFIGVLNLQSRMHPSVLEPINKLFYDGIIETNPSRKVNKNTERIINFIEKMLNNTINNHRIIFVDTILEERKKINVSQANLISKIINECFKEFNHFITNETFGVISPFRIQNSEIYSRLNPDVRNFVTIDTVERFQGSERDIIFLSLPFNSHLELFSSTNLVELEDGKIIDRKLNVALTRAKELLVIFGNLPLLSKIPFYKELLEFLINNSSVVKFS